VGDGTSRVVLKRAGLDQADAVVAATTDDERNLEVCRLAREADIRRLMAVANDPERVADYREVGIDAVSPDGLAARRIELNLETRRVSSMAFADGRAEAIEFRIAEDSPVRGKALKDLHAHSWIIGAILRGTELIIPHGETTLETGDLVTVVGAGADFAEMVRAFTAGRGRFPLDYGKRVAVALESEADLETAVAEAIQLVRGSRASSLLLVHRDPREVREDGGAARLRNLLALADQLSEGVEIRTRAVSSRPSRALVSIPRGESVGVIVVEGLRRAGMAGWRQTVRATSLARRTGRPVLLARGSYPYRSIVVPARRTTTARAAIRVGIDLARFNKAELHGVAVEDPLFISGPGAPLEARAAIGWLEEESAVHGVSVQGTIEHGNPVRVMKRHGEQADLVILGIAARRGRMVPRLGIAGFVARGLAKSVLLVPV
jgi:Trk K+ transport system NAD-binding subunit